MWLGKGKNWSTIYKKRLLRAKEYEQKSVEEIRGLLEKRLARFKETDLPRMVELFRKSLPKEPLDENESEMVKAESSPVRQVCRIPCQDAFTGAVLDVYTAEVDDKGIDFVIRKSDHEYYDVQVKSVRKAQYVYMTKETFRPRKNLLLALVIFEADNQ